MNSTCSNARLPHPLRLIACGIAALFSLTAAVDTRAIGADQVTSRIDPDQRVALAGQRPAWAKLANDQGAIPGDLTLNRVTLLLKRSTERQRAFDALLRAQQDPSSPDYRRWLSAAEIGARFGATPHDIDAIVAWLTDRNLRVEAVSPSRLRIRFSGSAADAANAFGTQLHRYTVAGEKRIATTAAPHIPAALADSVASVTGLDSIRLQPLHRGVEARDSAQLANSPRPSGTQCSGEECLHVVFPADFAKIYNLEGPYAQGIDGAGQSIAIVSRSRVSDADVQNFQDIAELPARLPVTIIPPDGIDPGPAATTCSETGTSSCDDPSDAVSDQMEATLDVERAGSAAPGATIKLIASASDDTSEGVFTALEYAIDTDPPPARIISISYGACEADNTAGAAAYLDSLFGHAAMQGISVFVSSGDSGAGDCAPHHEPPNGDLRRSTNMLCSSGHVTCVGGTQFVDTSEPDAYWTRDNGAGFLSARGYIPEGAWNESRTPGNGMQIAATGGGVSEYIATPTWQVGAGIDAAREGRYVPDISLNASSHTGYFTCIAALGGSCAPSGGSFRFMIGAGTSASAPSMAGIAALLNQKAGTAQGNLNPRLYALGGNPANGVFHDVTVASSGVGSCYTSFPSLCNNTTPAAESVTDGVAGYAVGLHHDLATGLGSVDAMRLLASWDDPQAAGIPLNQHGMTGTWANPATDSQGFVIDVEPDFHAPGAGLLFGGWFAYDLTEPGIQRWYTIQGQVNDNASATMPIYRTEGGLFDSPQATTTAMVGQATIAFEDCMHGSIRYVFDDGDGGAISGPSGTIPLTRLLSNITCAQIGQVDIDEPGSGGGLPGNEPPDYGQGGTSLTHLLSGAWADTANSGQGIVFDLNSPQNVLFAAWYTFATDIDHGSGLAPQRWYTLQSELPSNAARLDGVGIFNTSGGAFDQPADTITVQVGNADLVFRSCSSASLSYRYTSGENAGRSGTLDLHRVTPVPDGCHL